MLMVATEVVPAPILEMLGPPALLSTEDSLRYRKMLTLVARDIEPTDIIGWMLLKRLVDEFFEIARYRRFKAAWLERSSEKIRGPKVAALEGEMRLDPNWMTRWSLRNEIQKFDENRRRGWSGSYIEEFEEKRRMLAALDAQDAERRIGVGAKLEEAKASTSTEPELVNILPTYIEVYDQIDRMLRAAERRFNITRSEIDHHHRGLGAQLRAGFDAIMEADVISDGEVRPVAAGPPMVSRRRRNSVRREVGRRVGRASRQGCSTK